MNQSKTAQTLWGLFLLIGIAFLATLYYSAWNFTTDDAYITLRYSHHLFEGFGITWNIASPPVEGYSNFLYMLLGSVAEWIGLTPITVLKTTGMISLIATDVLLYHLSRRWMPPILSLFVPFTFSLYLGTIWWTVSGMETSFFVLLVTSITVLLCRAVDRPPRNITAFCIGLLLALAGLTRPEGPILWISSNVGLWWAVRHERKTWREFFIILNLSFLFPYGVYFLWRWWYFSRLLPNPVYCKAFDHQSPFVLVTEYLSLALPFMITALGFRDKRHVWLWLPSLYYLIIICGANPIIGYLTRHFLAAYALILVIGFSGAYQIMNRYLKTLQESLKQTVIFTIFLILIGLFVPRFSAERIQRSANECQKRSELRLRIADYLNQHTNPHDWVAMPDCGVIPYYSHANIIDTLCLNSREMTSPPINFSLDRFTTWLLNEAKPKFIVISTFSPMKQEDVLGDTIHHDPKLQQIFSAEYKSVHSDETRLNPPDYRYEVYERLNRQSPQ